MNNAPKSERLCPACQQPLSKRARSEWPFLLWCAYGPCTSKAAGDGGSGATEDEAYENLLKAVDNEQTPL